jgi:hypothetical protein
MKRKRRERVETHHRKEKEARGRVDSVTCHWVDVKTSFEWNLSGEREMVWAFCYGSLFQYAVFTDTFLDPKLPVIWNLYKLGIRKIVYINFYFLAGKFFLKKINFKKINYFLMFGSVMKNKLENIFQCLVMSWKISWKITY